MECLFKEIGVFTANRQAYKIVSKRRQWKNDKKSAEKTMSLLKKL